MKRPWATPEWTIWAACTVALLAFLQSVDTARAAGPASGMGGSGEGIFIAEIVLLLVVGRGLGELFQRFGQPGIMGQLVGGRTHLHGFQGDDIGGMRGGGKTGGEDEGDGEGFGVHGGPAWCV